LPLSMRLAVFFALAARASAAPVAESSATLNPAVTAADSDDADDGSAFNSNWLYKDRPLDSCLRGMPENVEVLSSIDAGAAARTGEEAHVLLSYWTELARTYSPDGCINATARNDKEFASGGGVDVSNKYKFGFREVAKIASNTMNSYLECRFDLPEGEKCDAGGCDLPEDYQKVTMWRNPHLRGVSGLFQMTMHYLTFLKLPPNLMQQCLDKWPDDKQRLSSDTLKKMPKFCEQAWTTNAFKGIDDPSPKVSPFDKIMIEQTVDSALLKALWELPGGCRTLSHGVSSEEPQNWFCGTSDNPSCDPQAACNLDDDGMAAILIAALKDLARTTSTGCQGKTWANEHMSTIFISTGVLRDVDAVMKLENVDEEQIKFEAFIEEKSGKKLPPASENCSFAAIHGNEGVENHGLNPELENHDLIKEVYTKSADIQQRLCVYYYQDYLCGGYEMLPACKGDPKTWMEGAMDRLVHGVPVDWSLSA